jgi:hypothetical protein
MLGNRQQKKTFDRFSKIDCERHNHPLPLILSLNSAEHLNVITLRASKVKSSPVAGFLPRLAVSEAGSDHDNDLHDNDLKSSEK